MSKIDRRPYVCQEMISYTVQLYVQGTAVQGTVTQLTTDRNFTHKESTAAVHNQKFITLHQSCACCIACWLERWEPDGQIALTVRGFDSRRRNLAEILQCATQSSEI